jgi:hypothetical protein
MRHLVVVCYTDLHGVLKLMHGAVLLHPVEVWHCAQLKTTVLSLYMTVHEVWIRTAEKCITYFEICVHIGGWTAVQCSPYVVLLSSMLSAHFTFNFNDPKSVILLLIRSFPSIVLQSAVS